MTFQQIRYLLEIHRTGSVAAAAKALYLVPSSLSIAVSNLEQELGCRIFERTRSGMVPTSEGLEILRYALNQEPAEDKKYKQLLRRHEFSKPNGQKEARAQ